MAVSPDANTFVQLVGDSLRLSLNDRNTIAVVDLSGYRTLAEPAVGPEGQWTTTPLHGNFFRLSMLTRRREAAVWA
jgi:hypothetical protein